MKRTNGLLYRIKGRTDKNGKPMEWVMMDMKDPSRVTKSFHTRSEAFKYARQLSRLKKTTDTRPLEHGSYRNMKSVTEKVNVPNFSSFLANVTDIALKRVTSEYGEDDMMIDSVYDVSQNNADTFMDFYRSAWKGNTTFEEATDDAVDFILDNVLGF